MISAVSMSLQVTDKEIRTLWVALVEVPVTVTVPDSGGGVIPSPPPLAPPLFT